MTAAYRRKYRNEILNLDPWNAGGGGSHGYDPIGAMPLDEDFPDDALGQAQAIIKIEGSEPHWPQAAQDLLAAVIMYVRLIIEGTYEDVRALISQDDAGISAMVKAKEFTYKGKLYPGMVTAADLDGWEEMATKAARFGTITAENKEMHGVLSTALVQTRWLDSRPIKRDLKGKQADGTSFDFSTLKKKPTTVYLTLPARRLGTHATWIRLILASIVQQLLKETSKPGDVPVLLMLDEYFAIAGGESGQADFPIIDKNMALFREYGIKLWTVWQDLSQAQKLYGREGFETFLANAGVLQSFATQDITTSDYLSKRTGQTTREIISGGQSRTIQPGQPTGQSTTESMNVGYIPMPPLMPQDIRNMDPGFSVVFSHMFKGFGFTYCPDPSESY